MPTDDGRAIRPETLHTEMDAAATRSVEFMLAEYQSLREQRKTLMQASHSEVTIFFGAVTAIGLALGFTFNKDDGLTSQFALIGSVVLAVLLAVGFATLWRLARFHGNSVRYTKGMNLIRQYFVVADSSIVHYLSLPIDDSKPSFQRLQGRVLYGIPVYGSNGIVILILNSAISAGLGYCAWVAISSTPEFAAIPAGVLMVAVWLVQSHYERTWFFKVQAEYENDRKSLLDFQSLVGTGTDT